MVCVCERRERGREREGEREGREREAEEGRKYLRVNVQRTGGGLLLSVLSTIMHCDTCEMMFLNLKCDIASSTLINVRPCCSLNINQIYNILQPFKIVLHTYYAFYVFYKEIGPMPRLDF